MSGELSILKAPKGATHVRKHKARGLGSGNGKTAGRGSKGQKARKSGNVRPGFEGGQMPMQRRFPKRGFKSLFGKEMVEVTIRDLNRFESGAVVDWTALKQAGLAKRRGYGVKVIGAGELKAKLEVHCSRVSEGAKKIIEAAGGTVKLIADRSSWVRQDTREKRRAAKRKPKAG